MITPESVLDVDDINEIGPEKDLRLFLPMDGDLLDYSGNGLDSIANSGTLSAGIGKYQSYYYSSTYTETG
jgi:hypothetical protein